MSEEQASPKPPKSPEEIEKRIKYLELYRQDIHGLNQMTLSLEDRGEFRSRLCDELLRVGAELGVLRWALSLPDRSTNDIPF